MKVVIVIILAHGETSRGVYKEAIDIAKKKLSLSPNHPIRLELDLKYAVLCHDVLGEKKEAWHFAKEASKIKYETTNHLHLDI